MASGSWRGHLRLSLVTCPVRLQPAASEAGRVHLHLLNKRTRHRVHQVLRDAETDAPVERTDTVRGYEYDEDRYVVLDDKDLKKAQQAVESAHVIDLARFVDLGEVDDLYFEDNYWVVPDGPLARETYDVIIGAMRAKKKAAIASLTLTSREHPALLRVRGDGLILTTLRSPEEMREPELPAAKKGRKTVDAETAEMAAMIIDKKSGPFDPALFEDRYQAALRQIIEAKVRGEKPALKKAAEPGKVVNLFEALKRSLAEDDKKPARAKHKAS